MRYGAVVMDTSLPSLIFNAEIDYDFRQSSYYSDLQ